MEKLQSLVETLQVQHASKADYIMPAKKLRVNEAGLLVPEGTKQTIYTPNQVFHDGAAFMLNIPGGYYKRMLDAAPALLAQNVNTWLDLRKETSGIMLRTFENLGGQNVARAILSDRYNVLDNYDVLFTALEAIQKAGIHVEIREATVTDKKLYVVLVCPEIQVVSHEALRNYRGTKGMEVNDMIVSGMIISNSEVGWGSYEIRPRAEVVKCGNGAIGTDDRFRRVHLGAQLKEGQIQWSDATKQKNYELVISQTQDAIKEFLSLGYLQGMVQKMEVAAGTKLERPLDTVQNVCRELLIPEEHRDNILKFFVEGADTSAGGVVQALTAGAQLMNPDARYDLEEKAFGLMSKITNFDRPFSKS